MYAYSVCLHIIELYTYLAYFVYFHGFLCVSMPRDCKRAVHTTCIMVYACYDKQDIYGHVMSDFITNGIHKHAMNMQK
jgi:hypothetical protein